MKFWLLDSTWKSTFRRSLVCIHLDRYTSSCKRQSIDLRPFQKFSNSREFSRCQFAREYVRDAALILIISAVNGLMPCSCTREVSSRFMEISSVMHMHDMWSTLPCFPRVWTHIISSLLDDNIEDNIFVPEISRSSSCLGYTLAVSGSPQSRTSLLSRPVCAFALLAVIFWTSTSS